MKLWVAAQLRERAIFFIFSTIEHVLLASFNQGMFDGVNVQPLGTIAGALRLTAYLLCFLLQMAMASVMSASTVQRPSVAKVRFTTYIKWIRGGK
jgi:hypothetical protein